VTTPTALLGTRQPEREPEPHRRRVRPQTIVNYTLVALVMIAYLFPLFFLVNTALKSQQDFFTDPVASSPAPSSATSSSHGRAATSARTSATASCTRSAGRVSAPSSRS